MQQPPSKAKKQITLQKCFESQQVRSAQGPPQRSRLLLLPHVQGLLPSTLPVHVAPAAHFIWRPSRQKALQARRGAQVHRIRGLQQRQRQRSLWQPAGFVGGWSGVVGRSSRKRAGEGSKGFICMSYTFNDPNQPRNTATGPEV